MKLGLNSWHAKLNKFVYGGNYLYGVDCLCPYFWGTLLAVILFPFAVMFKGIAMGIKAIPRRDWEFPTIQITEDTKDKLLRIIAFTVLFLLGFSVSYAITWGILEYGLEHVLFVIGVIIAVGVGIVVATVFIVKLSEHINNWLKGRPKKEKKPNIFVEMFKAKKNKHCPLVQWVD